MTRTAGHPAIFLSRLSAVKHLAPLRRLPVILLGAALIASGCSSDSNEGTTKGTTTTTSTSTTASQSPYNGHECDSGLSSDKMEVTKVDGSDSDFTLSSFDDTEIRLHWFPVKGATKDKPAPTIMMGPGWSLGGDTNTEGGALFGALSIGGMWEQGYNVLTWDPRGFGQSGGVASVNDPEKEGRDAQLLLDFVASRPEAQSDDDGDPRVGMVGYSYGGGIQLTLAGIDCRVDAIVPGIAWHSLETSLYKQETVKTGWASILTSTVPENRLDPHIVSATKSGLGNGLLSDEDREWFISRGPGDELVGKITVPTLLVGGTVDNLFTLQENLTNFNILQGNNVAVSMVWFCGGHGTCLTNAGDTQQAAKSSFAWLARYVKGDQDAEALATLDLLDQNGQRWIADSWPLADAAVLRSEGSGSLDLTDESVSGGAAMEPVEGDQLGFLTMAITPTKASKAIDVRVATEESALLLGAPKISFTYTGTLPEGETDGRVFAQLVDDDTDLVLGNQVTPIKVTLDGEQHTIELPLEVIAHYLDASSSLTLQIVATTTAYATPPLGGSIDITDLSLDLPVAPTKSVKKG